MTYISVLPQVFPQSVNLEPADAIRAINLLTDLDRTDAPFGSSFALTVERAARHGTWSLWLSSTSYNYLLNHPDFSEVLP